MVVAGHGWSSYTPPIVREFASADSVLVILDEWSSYRGGRLNSFDFMLLYLQGLQHASIQVDGTSIKKAVIKVLA